MRKVVFWNALVTFLAFILDVYGVFNLSFSVALISLFVGIIDVLAFIWISEEFKKEREKIGRRKK